jgi:hypothetical protein
MKGAPPRRSEENAMPKTLKPGDKVRWNSSGGESVGRVVKKLTSPTRIKSHKVAASPDDPQYLVESGRSGGAPPTSPRP